MLLLVRVTLKLHGVVIFFARRRTAVKIDTFNNIQHNKCLGIQGELKIIYVPKDTKNESPLLITSSGFFTRNISEQLKRKKILMPTQAYFDALLSRIYRGIVICLSKFCGSKETDSVQIFRMQTPYVGIHVVGHLCHNMVVRNGRLMDCNTAYDSLHNAFGPNRPAHSVYRELVSKGQDPKPPTNVFISQQCAIPVQLDKSNLNEQTQADMLYEPDVYEKKVPRDKIKFVDLLCQCRLAEKTISSKETNNVNEIDASKPRSK